MNTENNKEETSYEGETSRTLYTRYKQHMSDYLKASRDQTENTESSWMWDHNISAHNGEMSNDPAEDFKFNVIRRYKQPMERQIAEALRIEQAMNGSVGEGNKRILCQSLNRKFEHFAPIQRRDNDG